MRIAILSFSALNSSEEQKIVLAVKRAGMTPEKCLWNETDKELKKYAGYILAGNFSDPAAPNRMMQEVRSEAHLGKPVLGICHGAQILLETGLVPGVENDKPCITLTTDTHSSEEIRAHMRVSDHYQLNAFTRRLNPKNILSISPNDPKKYFVIPPALLAEMQLLGSSVFLYCDANGKEFSDNAIAAVSNKTGNVMAMIAHPGFTPEGDPVFQSMRDYIQEGYVQRVLPMNYYPR